MGKHFHLESYFGRSGMNRSISHVYLITPRRTGERERGMGGEREREGNAVRMLLQLSEGKKSLELNQWL